MGNISYEKVLFNAIKNGQVSVKSVYDIWLEIGNEVSPQDFIDSLKGDPGVSPIVVKGHTISTSTWMLTDGIYKAVIGDTNVTADNIVNINFDGDINVAINNGVLGYTNTIDGAFEIYSNFLPVSDLVINYSIV
jgi:hypothetical protein